MGNGFPSSDSQDIAQEGVPEQPDRSSANAVLSLHNHAHAQTFFCWVRWFCPRQTMPSKPRLPRVRRQAQLINRQQPHASCCLRSSSRCRSHYDVAPLSASSTTAERDGFVSVTPRCPGILNRYYLPLFSPGSTPPEWCHCCSPSAFISMLSSRDSATCQPTLTTVRSLSR